MPFISHNLSANNEMQLSSRANVFSNDNDLGILPSVDGLQPRLGCQPGSLQVYSGGQQVCPLNTDH